MKKLLCLIVVLANIMYITVSANAITLTETAKTDLHNYGIMIGDENGDLRLADNITRAEFCKMICAALGFKDAKSIRHSVVEDFYDVDTIIRVGSAGAISPELHLRDVVFGMGACTNSAYADQYRLPGTFAPIADYGTLQNAVKAAERLGVKPYIGNLLSSDTFYDDANSLAEWQKMGVLAIEMECAALYMNAARSSKKALAICTISDCPLSSGEECTALEREQTFNKMIEIALEAAE